MSREPLLVCRTYLEEGMERFDERIVKPENIRVRVYPGAHNLGGTPGRGSGIPEYDRERTGGQGVEHLRLSINASPVVTANFPASGLPIRKLRTGPIILLEFTRDSPRNLLVQSQELRICASNTESKVKCKLKSECRRGCRVCGKTAHRKRDGDLG